MHKGDLTTLNIIHRWLGVIHSLVGRYQTEKNINDENDSQVINSLQPQVILVGTHRNSVHLEPITRDQIIKETFDKIFSSLDGKSYRDHLNISWIALDCNEMSYNEPRLLKELKSTIDQVIKKEKLVGFDIPVAWLEFEQIVMRLRHRGIYFADVNQLHEVVRSRSDAFQSYDALNAALHFYHNQGKVLCLDHIGSMILPESNGIYDCGIIILDPKWFLQCVYKLCSSIKNESNEDYVQFGILNEQLINQTWSDCIEQKYVLLGCLEKLDIIGMYLFFKEY